MKKQTENGASTRRTHIANYLMMLVSFLMTTAVTAAAAASPSFSTLRRALQDTAAAKECNGNIPPLNFTVVDGDAVASAIEDDIRSNLQAVGISINTVRVPKDDFNDLQTSGQFHLSFSESYGEPYDPQSYASGWIRGNGGEGHHQAFTNFEPPSTREELYELVEEVLTVQNRKERQEKWDVIHNYYHAQAVMLPLWGKRIPTLLNSRITNYEAGNQQFDYPVHRLVPTTGSSEITISPGGQTGLFKTVGRLDPHTYRPNEFFSNNWVYEGLVRYGEGGQVLPALAESWVVEDNPASGGEKVTFQLRQNVTFHDGAAWDCNVAKMNFDHVFAGELKTEGWHGWYGVPLSLEEWTCESDFTFVITTSVKYYPLLQEMTYIRPLRMMSPLAFAQGSDSDPFLHNSCHVGWGTITSPERGLPNVTCAGIANISGTGPLAFSSRTQSEIPTSTGETETVDDEVVFVTNKQYWGGAPEYDSLKVVRYETAGDVQDALLNNELDVVWGAGVLSERIVAAIQDNDEFQGQINVFYSEDIQNVIMLLNSGQPPLDDIEVRKIIIHAINKANIVAKEKVGDVVDNVFPRHAPYCDVDLTPRWDYDIEKAALLSCTREGASGGDDGDDNNNSALAWGLGLGLGIPCAILLVAAIYYYRQSKQYEIEWQAQMEEGIDDATDDVIMEEGPEDSYKEA